MSRPYTKGGGPNRADSRRRRKGDYDRDVLTDRGGHNSSWNAKPDRSRRGSRGGSGPPGKGTGGSDNQVPQSTMMTTLLDLLFQKSSSVIFNRESGMLNLSNFSQSQDLTDVRKSVDFNNVTFCRSLVSVIKSHMGSMLRAVAVNDNKITKLSVFLSALVEADLHIGITALSATGNTIDDLSFIGPLKRFVNLGELVLKENPVTRREDYNSSVIQKVKSLMMLDDKVINRAPLRLPNPIPSSLSQLQFQVLYFLEADVFSAAAEGKWDTLTGVYAKNALFSVSRSEEPIACRIPFDAKHKSDALNPTQRKVMTDDFVFLRKNVPWRNLHVEIHSLRSIACGQTKAVKAINILGGGERKFFSVSHELNGNANVVFLSDNMAVPTCVLTIHGRLFWHWSPIDGGEKIFARDDAPFVSCFFHRTMSLTLDPNGTTWSVHNDMMFLRPDRLLRQESGEKALPMFFANDPMRIEEMRRRYLPQAKTDVMKTIVEAVSSDADVVGFIQNCLAKLPPDQLEIALSASDVMANLLGG
ncbi:hypothetical protein, conserved [Trypanosoma brucei gambiense DAL972]|uniref:MEX67-like NTF2-like domain-containing protein n=1 Tax=Trypanosoma brucei gambiense (strain MHOM/CI/86/DAL972) TaxID=679716 RepID=D0A641_TRYB9|nr:hypothetical protein, conserved [Trypanosoma brucei gambiense DAL972]CBH17142.1 hypothetical protein, conserved [Trypanosoma brucei gambiense DAL972]|eukprot:XP_011779406.1 hypothetical protein, conserved [Trypanosoma brucei gambiense DAL972]